MAETWKSFKGIDFQEMDGSGGVHLDLGGGTATRIFRVAWSDRFLFLAVVLSGVELVGNVIRATTPVSMPGFPFLRAMGADMSGFGASDDSGVDGEIAYEFAKIIVNYSTFGFTGETGGVDFRAALRTESLEIAGEFLQAPDRFYRWTDDNKPVEEAVGLLIPAFEYTVTEHKTVGNPAVRVAPLQGSVNNAVFFGIGAEKMLYLGASATRSINMIGPMPWRVTHKFKVRARGWNEVLKRKTQTWVKVTPNIYDLADLSQVFAP